MFFILVCNSAVLYLLRFVYYWWW